MNQIFTVATSSSPMLSAERNGTDATDEQLISAFVSLVTTISVIALFSLMFWVLLGICLYRKYCRRERSSASRRRQEDNVREEETSTVLKNRSAREREENDHSESPSYSFGLQMQKSDTLSSITSSSSAHPPSTGEELSKNTHYSQERQTSCGTQSGQSSQNEETSRPDIQATLGNNDPFKVPRKRKGTRGRRKKGGEIDSNDGFTSGYSSKSSSVENIASGFTFLQNQMTTIDIKPEGVRCDKDNEFSLEIPEGAIPERERLTVDVGVAFFGPFQFPEGLRPVSPVLWVCVRDNPNFRFLKPFTVTLPHILDLENDEDIQSMGLTFLKAHHNKNSEGRYEFMPTDGEMDFITSNKTGTLKSTHFCSFCIGSKDEPYVLTRTEFCMTSILPICANLDRKRQCGFFFITFNNLSTCLVKVDQIIAGKSLENYRKSEVKFKFKSVVKKSALKIDITQPNHGAIGLEGKNKILRRDVDFFIRKRTAREDLEAEERRDLYPPRFKVFFASSLKDPTLRGGKIKFKGAETDLEYDIYLDPPTPLMVTANMFAQDVGIIDRRTDDHEKSQLLDINDIHEVWSQLLPEEVRWREIGLALGLSCPRLERIRANSDDVTSCMMGMLREWLTKNYDTTRHGEPSWETLSKAIRRRAGGNNASLANDILHYTTSRSPPPHNTLRLETEV